MLTRALAQQLFELSRDLICSLHLDGHLEDLNPHWLGVLGYSRDEVLARPWVELIHPDDRARTLEIAAQATAGARIDGFENRVVTRDGQVRHLLWSAVPVPDEPRVLAIAKDVTERREREDDLERARHLLAEAERIARLGSWEWETGAPEGRFSPALRDLLGIGAEDSARFDVHARNLHREDVERAHEALRRLLEHGGSIELRVRRRRPDGTTAVLLHRAKAEMGADGRVARIYGTVQDVSEQEEMTRRLRRMAEAAVDITGAPSMHDALDATTRAARDVLRVQQVATLLSGYDGDGPRSLWCSERLAHWPPAPEFQGDGLARLVLEQQAPMRLSDEELRAHPLWRPAPGRGTLRGWLAAPLVAKDGSTLGVVQVSHPAWGELTPDDEQLLVQLAQTASTALERLDLEERFRHVQRVDAVGRLAAGILHDFTNTLSVVLVHSQLLRDAVTDPDAAHHADQLHAAARAAADVAGDLLELSRTDAEAPAPRPAQPTDARDVAGEVARLAEPVLGPGIALEVDLPDEALPTLVGRTDLQQALMNLVLNARDAIAGSGTIVVGAHASGDDVVLRVQDDGAGMDAELQARIFTPYFTTKAERGGTGLGLAGVQTIVARAGGRIDLRSEPGRGSTFLLHLPHAARAAALVPAAASRVLPGGDETIAVVGRNRSVVAVIEAVLDSLGYVVVPSRADRDPDLHGASLVIVEDGASAVVRPPEGTPVLYVLGPDADPPGGACEPHVLRRPLSADALARTVRQILDDRRARGPGPVPRGDGWPMAGARSSVRPGHMT